MAKKMNSRVGMIAHKGQEARHLSRRNGSVILEFALVVPLLLLMLIGIMEFGWLVKNNLTIANATREGARVASVGRTTSEIQTRIQNSASPLKVTSPDGSIDMKWSDNNGADGYPYTVTDSGTKNGVMAGKLIKITVRSQHKTLTRFPILSNRNVESYATMRRE